MASIGFMSAKCLRRIQTRCKVSLSINKSSRLVPEVRICPIAGNILLFDIFLSNCSSMLPVPLNSSKITSSILEPVSVNAVAKIVNEPPFFNFSSCSKKSFRFMKRIRINSTSKYFARRRRYRIVSSC